MNRAAAWRQRTALPGHRRARQRPGGRPAGRDRCGALCSRDIRLTCDVSTTVASPAARPAPAQETRPAVRRPHRPSRTGARPSLAGISPIPKRFSCSTVVAKPPSVATTEDAVAILEPQPFPRSGPSELGAFYPPRGQGRDAKGLTRLASASLSRARTPLPAVRRPPALFGLLDHGHRHSEPDGALATVWTSGASTKPPRREPSVPCPSKFTPTTWSTPPPGRCRPARQAQRSPPFLPQR
jgi:hypothetical protein